MSSTNSSSDAVKSIIARLAHHTDAKRWDQLQGLFAPEVDVDIG